MARKYERKIPILDCGHDYIRKVLYGRWKIAILLRLAKGINRPGELSRSIPQATRRVLDLQLAELLSHEIVSKEVFDEAVQHVEYRLTNLGRSLMPVIDAMGNWGKDHIDDLKKLVK
jgi:DNA-binding HxlR family transcriptional regulator